MSVVFLSKLHTQYHGPILATSNCILKLISIDSASKLKLKLRIKPDIPAAFCESGYVDYLRTTPKLSPKPALPLDAKLNGTKVSVLAV